MGKVAIELTSKPDFGQDLCHTISQPFSNDSEILLKTESNLFHHEKRAVLRKLVKVILLAVIFMTLEIIGGLLADSIAILSDAAHMLSDLLSFVISIVSVWISTFPSNNKNSFGYHRAGVVGALASVALIWILTGFLVYYSILRMINLDEVKLDGQIMLITSILGLGMNLVMVKVLHGSEHGHDHCSHNHGNDHVHDHCSHNHNKHNHNHISDRIEMHNYNPPHSSKNNLYFMNILREQ